MSRFPSLLFDCAAAGDLKAIKLGPLLPVQCIFISSSYATFLCNTGLLLATSWDTGLLQVWCALPSTPSKSWCVLNRMTWPIRRMYWTNVHIKQQIGKDSSLSLGALPMVEQYRYIYIAPKKDADKGQDGVSRMLWMIFSSNFRGSKVLSALTFGGTYCSRWVDWWHRIQPFGPAICLGVGKTSFFIADGANAWAFAVVCLG